MTRGQFRYGKKLIQAWVPEDLLERIFRVSKKGITEIVIESLDLYLNNCKSEKEQAEERYNNALLETATAKAELDKINKIEIDNKIIKEKLAIKNKREPFSSDINEKELNERWELKIRPLIKKKISVLGFDKVISDERMLNNFSRALCISTGELKEKISTELGVV